MLCDSPIGVNASVVSEWIKRAMEVCNHELTPSHGGEPSMCACQRFIKSIIVEYTTELTRRSVLKAERNPSFGAQEALEEIDRQSNLELELTTAHERVIELERQNRALREAFRVYISNVYSEEERGKIAAQMEKAEI
jgi:hypothetical protein